MHGVNSTSAEVAFKRYLLNNHELDLISILVNENAQQHFSVTVLYQFLLNEEVELGQTLLDQPISSLTIFDKALKLSLCSLYDERRHGDSTLSLKQNVHTRISMPDLSGFSLSVMPRTNDVGLFICVVGTVVRTASPKLLEYKKDFMCSKCHHVFTVCADHDQYYQLIKPNRCPNPDGGCFSNQFNPVSLNSTPIFTKDYQEIKMQEQVQKLVVGTMPRSIWVSLEDDLVDACKPGDDVLVSGVVLRRWQSLTKDTRIDIDVIIKANHISVRNKHRLNASVTDEMKAKFSAFWEEHKYNPLAGRNDLLASFCPQVYGLYIVKLAVAIVIAGGVQKVDSSGTRIRGESHLLLVGDPGTGKSQFLKYVGSLVPRCVLTTGIGTTNAGLTVAAIREGSEWALEAGALVLADGGICCIDEFNSIREADRATIHEAMEQQTISMAKAGMVCKLNSRCSILAATNPKGHYDVNECLSINVALGSPLLSRFDLILVLMDTRNQTWDEMVSSYILQGKDPLPSTEGKVQDKRWSLELLRAYFCHVRSLQPVMTPFANAILAKYYQLQRATDNRSQARTTIRLLESLVRLSQGHARLMSRSEVSVMDAISAVCLIEASNVGSSLMPGVNMLHCMFPLDPRGEYKIQVETILQKLNLSEIMDEELRRIDIEENQQSQFITNEATVLFEKSETNKQKVEDKLACRIAAPDASVISEKNLRSSQKFNLRLAEKIRPKQQQSLMGKNSAERIKDTENISLHDVENIQESENVIFNENIQDNFNNIHDVEKIRGNKTIEDGRQNQNITSERKGFQNSVPRTSTKVTPNIMNLLGSFKRKQPESCFMKRIKIIGSTVTNEVENRMVNCRMAAPLHEGKSQNERPALCSTDILIETQSEVDIGTNQSRFPSPRNSTAEKLKRFSCKFSEKKKVCEIKNEMMNTCVGDTDSKIESGDTSNCCHDSENGADTTLSVSEDSGFDSAASSVANNSLLNFDDKIRTENPENEINFPNVGKMNDINLVKNNISEIGSKMFVPEFTKSNQSILPLKRPTFSQSSVNSLSSLLPSSLTSGEHVDVGSKFVNLDFSDFELNLK